MAVVKTVRATKTSQQRVEQLAEKEGKANERAAKVAEKAIWNVANTASRGHRCARGHRRGIGQGRERARVLMLFPTELLSQLDSSNTEDSKHLTHPTQTWVMEMITRVTHQDHT